MEFQVYPNIIDQSLDPILAAVDIGTSNCRLLVARPDQLEFQVVDSFSRVVRLGEGVKETNVLLESAIDRTIEALEICAGKMSKNRVTFSRVVATEACRKAKNRDEFVDRVKSETGISIEIITSQEEAELALLGCSPLFDNKIDNTMVFDIGGGSTELIWTSRRNDQAIQSVQSVSIPVGVINFKDKYGGDRFDDGIYEAMIASCISSFDKFSILDDVVNKIDAGIMELLGASGTVTTLAAIHLGLKRYSRNRVDGVFLQFSDLKKITRSLSKMSFKERSDQASIGLDRADLMVPGCAILEAICCKFPIGSLRVADRGVREGILFNLIQKLQG
jgi:exopolyphosphatase/guanosine-5'-triphosphate,3'-diphosphate pyrophosphatase